MKWEAVSHTRRIVSINFGRNDWGKKSHRKTTITIHESDYGRPRIKEEGQRQKIYGNFCKPIIRLKAAEEEFYFEICYIIINLKIICNSNFTYLPLIFRFPICNIFIKFIWESQFSGELITEGHFF